MSELNESQIREMVAEILDLEISVVNDSFSRETSANWDSFQHLLLISELENRLSIKFTIDEISSINDYKVLKELILNKFPDKK